ncbi:MAG: hypothetical protein EPO07_04680 [Verrucomicrobia bacterium]|nr:MAG: hypothetical protein EPO07_04680 [Verrucomicrobiota bacterium]
MTSRKLFLIGALIGICLLSLVAWVMLAPPGNPVALIRVVDAKGNPIAGAVITPDGLRPKSGPYSSGHYGWQGNLNGVSNAPALTDADGYARVPYPQFVFERIETGQISFSVRHPDYVSDRPFREVASKPPAHAPWKVWGNYLWSRIRAVKLIAVTDPVVLNRGAVVKLSLAGDDPRLNSGQLFAQVSGVWNFRNGFWTRIESGTIIARGVPTGQRELRAFLAATNGTVRFSEVMTIDAIAGQTNTLAMQLHPGVSLRGELDSTVPRPVTNGRVIAQITPFGSRPADSPPLWHVFTAINADGSFAFNSLPDGDLEIVALCDGFVSTNGPSTFRGMRFPQKHQINSNDLTITIGMEPTACLEVRVQDDKGKPLSGAHVSTWPNVQYGGWSSTILASDCYNTMDAYETLQRTGKAPRWRTTVSSFEGETDASGAAMLRNLPVETRAFTVEHTNFYLPAVSDGSGRKIRETRITLTPGTTNHSTVQLELRNQSAITHY